MVSPSICGGFLSDKHSMMAFTWTISTLMTLLAFLVAIVLTIQIHTHYRRMERYYKSGDYYDQYYQNYGQNEGDGDEDGSQDHEQYNMESADRIAQSAMLLSSLSSRSISFVAVYTMLLAVALQLYGSTAIVGFTSLQGVYIAPCFSSSGMSHNNMHVGMFGGAIVIFANLLVVGAVILGEVRVDSGYGNRDGEADEDSEPYQVERIATVLAVTFIFLSALYCFFAVLLFLCYASDEHYVDRRLHGLSEDHHVGVSENGPIPKPLVSVKAADARHHSSIENPGFITMDDSC